MTGPKRYGVICSAKPLGETVSIRALNGLVFITYTFELFGRAGAVAGQSMVPNGYVRAPLSIGHGFLGVFGYLVSQGNPRLLVPRPFWYDRTLLHRASHCVNWLM